MGSVRRTMLPALAALLFFAGLSRVDGAGPDYNEKIAPLFKKYCVGCHNRDDHEGKLSLASFADLQLGGEHGPAVLASQGASSRLVRVLTGAAEPKMPPEGNEGPTPEEIALIQAWIDAGARGPEGVEPSPRSLVVPRIPAAQRPLPVTAFAFSPDGQQAAVGRSQELVLQRTAIGETVRTLKALPGPVKAAHFSRDGGRLIVATGVPGLFGTALLWDTASGELVREFSAHRDILYDAELSPDGTWLATCSYDRRIVLWKVETGEKVRSLEGHNDAIYDLAFSPDGTILASASGDQTVKLWQTATGVRLDTLSQPQAEQYTVCFSPDGRRVAAGGRDNRIRVWQVVSREQPRINPLEHARFGHEGAILRLGYTPDGKYLVSAGEDQVLRLWDATSVTPVHIYEKQSDDIAEIAMRPDSSGFAVARLDGTLATYPIVAGSRANNAAASTPAAPVVTAAPQDAPLMAVAEAEPNDGSANAQLIRIPAKISGRIQSGLAEGKADADVYRFSALRGQQIVLEVHAARSKSPLDSKIEVLDAAGQPITQVLLQAVRDSYFTFRGKDSDTSDDFRVQNWQEMELNEYLFSDGEVVKLWLYPRGPDSGFKVYPGEGKRTTYFGTTPVAHALQAPCYIVEPHEPGESLVPNGLPVFPVFYENDDDSQRRFGADSFLIFTAPSDGEFLVRVRDTRGFGGQDYAYDLDVRPRQLDFSVSLAGAGPTINRGSGKEFTVTAERLDGFEGEIQITVENLPPGLSVSSPLVIEAGQRSAVGLIYAAPDAPTPTAEVAKGTKVLAHAAIGGRQITHDVGTLGEIKITDKPKVIVTLAASQEHPQAAVPTVADGQASPAGTAPFELAIAPGETITAKVRVERNGFDGRIQFGNADSGRNMPHGVFVDNIGLNGLLIPEGETERTFFITAAKWVPETRRPFHLKADADGGQTSYPVILHVRPK